MSIKGSCTTASYVEWNLAHQIIGDLIGIREYRKALLVSTGIYTGLRIGDILTLKWSNVLGQNKIIMIEKKTGKRREIVINPFLQKMIEDTHIEINPFRDDYLIFRSPENAYYPLNRTTVNRWLKEIFKDYPVSGNVSSHMLRKTFGRRIWENNNQSDSALIMLGELFNHVSSITTKRYLGIRQEELGSLYESL